MILRADARHIPLPDRSVHCVVTSPPYWGLRDYSTGEAEPLGLEPTPDLYVQHMVEIFREVRRVLRDDGTLWLNLGDSYSAGGGKQVLQTKNASHGLEGMRQQTPWIRPKQLLGIPWRVAFALQADGWYLRSDIIWSKPNPMPESVRDRPTKSHEYLFLLSKSERYFYDAEAIAEPATLSWLARWDQDIEGQQGSFRANGGAKTNGAMKAVGKGGANAVRGQGSNRETPNGPANREGRDMRDVGASLTRNARTVWEIATQAYSGAHFATFPEELARRCIAAGTSERGCCPKCGAGWERAIWRESRPNVNNCNSKGDVYPHRVSGGVGNDRRERETTGWQPTCECNAGEPVPCIVFDPFCGAGTTARVAALMGRRFVAVDIKQEYLKLAAERVPPLLFSWWKPVLL